MNLIVHGDCNKHADLSHLQRRPHIESSRNVQGGASGLLVCSANRLLLLLPQLSAIAVFAELISGQPVKFMETWNSRGFLDQR